MFPSSLFEVEYARMRDVQDLAETGEYGDNVGPARKLARLSDLVGLGGGGSTFSKTEADGLYAPKTGSTEYATQFDVALGLAAKAEVGHTHSGLYQPWGDYLVAADIAGKADAATVYTKTQVDTALSGKVDTAGVTAALATKSDVTHTHTGVYQPAGSYLVAADIAGKADTTTTYTKTQVDTALATKSDTTHTHTGVYQPVGTYLTSADLTAALVNYALKTEVSTKADVTYVNTQLAAYVKGSRLHDDLRRYNPMLQPRLDLTIPLTTSIYYGLVDGDIPAWKIYGGVSLYKTTPTIPLLNTHNTLVAIRGLGTLVATNPGYVEQTRTDLQVGASYRFCVRAVWHDWTGHTHPYIRLQVRDTSNSTVVDEAMLTNLAAVAKNTANAPPLFGVSFIAPASGSVALQIANMGPDTANGATGTATSGETFIFISQAYLVQSN